VSVRVTGCPGGRVCVGLCERYSTAVPRARMLLDPSIM
jgi:hypothetical protein